MKQLVSFFVGILCSMQLAIAQPYKPLLDNFNEWHFTTCFSGCNTDVYYTNGDTIVGGLSYKILDGYHYMSRTFLLREDVANRQVTMAKINPTKIDEFLLYDFGKNEGDTMELFNPNSPFIESPGYFRLDSIRSHPLEDGNSYRHFYWSPAPGNTSYIAYPVWVEGVGSLSLINAPGSQPDFNGVGQLNCFFKNSDAFYVNLDSIQSCEPVHVLGMETIEVPEWIIYPNPSSGIIQINGLKAEIFIEITSYTGELIKQVKITGLSPVDVSFLQNGTYFIRLDNHYLKFVKQ
jgi:hypothetical protein